MADEGAPSSLAELMEPAPAPTPPAEPALDVAVSARKPRGRPPGSKNKPKPPVVVTRESAAAMRPVVLELASGCDVVSAVSAFARRRGVGVSVLCGRGAVAAVTLRLAASPAAASAVTLHGRFEVLSLSGTVLPSAGASAPFSLSLAGTGGQVIGGTLAGEMTAAADGVVVVAATFGSAEVHRLPAAEDEQVALAVGGGRREEGRQQQVAAGAGDVVGLGLAGGYGGAAVELGGARRVGHVVDVGQHAQVPLWAQPTSSREPK
ncbi:hypothetical protein U9M48_016473 [Paspalum notatum var. saurae]|uniref:PPC domain-containing protein n=1 Tax=Paspalum notatum var. saurae TaxID=547442 RepID=A0AAQ3T7K4_PASNO